VYIEVGWIEVWRTHAADPYNHHNKHSFMLVKYNSKNAVSETCMPKARQKKREHDTAYSVMTVAASPSGEWQYIV